MRLVHLADLHLGFRQFQRLNAAGTNQREADVAATFARAVDQIIAVAPDAIVVGGDVFHTVRPSNATIVQAYRNFAKLREALPHCPMVIAAGNHDAPRTKDTGCILDLFRELDIRVADESWRYFQFPELSLSVLAVPDVPGIVRPPLIPESGFAHNVLLLHGEVQGMLSAVAAPTDRATVEISKEELHAERWDYVALGHYHVRREVVPRGYYSGSIDYTSSNPWGELREERENGIPGKGFIVQELDTGAFEFHPVTPARVPLDLDAIDARGMDAIALDVAIRARVESAPTGIDDRIVRLVVRNAPRHVVRDLDHQMLRGYRRRALHFHLDTRKPEARPTRTGEGAPSRKATLPEVVAEYLRDRALPAELNRDQFVTLGLRYLREVEDTLTVVPELETR